MLVTLAMNGGLIGWGVICFLFTLGFTAWLVRYFARPNTPIAIYVVTWLAWVCSFSVIWLVPLDVDESSHDSLFTIWNIVFWVGFVTTWLLLPMVQEYYDNGGFTPQQKLLLALKQNLILVAIAGTLVTLLIIYMAVARGLDTSTIGVRHAQRTYRETHRQLAGEQRDDTTVRVPQRSGWENCCGFGGGD